MLKRLTPPSTALIILLTIVSLCVLGIAEANTAPTAVGTIADQALDVGGTAATVDVSANFSDPDGDTLTYTVSSSDTAVATASMSDTTVTITPVAAGTATITVTATDPGGSTAEQTISVTVTQPNRAPTAVGTISDQTVNVGANPATVDVSANFSDPDGDTLTYTATSSDTAIATVSVSGATITLTFVAEGSGTATITVTATDPDGLTAEQTFSITVTQPNRAPIAVGTIADQALTVGGTAATVDVSANFSDPDGDTLTYTASSSDDSIATVSVSSATVTVTAVAAGSATITVTAADPDGLTVEQSISVTVTQPNRAPAASGTIPDGSPAIGGAEYSVDVSTYFTDADNDTLTYTASSSDTAIATASVSNSTVTVTGVAVGSATITVTATDPDSLTANQTFSVTVIQANRAPTAANTIPDQSVTVGGSAATVDVSSSFSDPDGDTLTYTATSSDTAIATTSVSSATVTITPVAGGTATLTVMATDPDGLSVDQTIAVTVTQPNRAPAASGTIPDGSAPIGGTAYSVDVSTYFIDADDDTLTYTASSSDTAIATASVSDSTVTVTGVAVGSATITVTATDPDSLTAEQTFSVSVTQPNRAPVAVGTIPNQSLTVGGNKVTFNAKEYFSDPDGDTLPVATASIRRSNDAIIDVNAYGNWDVDLVPKAGGTVTVSITVSDPGGLSVTQSFSVTVIQPNRAPTAVGTIADRNMNRDFDPITVDVSDNFSDADGDTLTYTATSSDTAVVTVEVSSATLTLTQLATGTSTVTVTATDPDGLTVDQTFTITVRQHNQPRTVGTIPDYTLKAGKTLTIEASQYFNDPDGAFRYEESLSGVGPSITRSTSGTIVTFEVWSNSAPGSMTASITAYGEGTTLPKPHATQTFTITVVSANRAPTTEGTISDQALILGQSSDPTIDVSDYFSDADGDALTYTASSSDTARVTVSLSDTTLTVTPVAAGGSATITVTATDTEGTTANQTFSVGVKGAPVAVGTIPLQKLEVGGDSISFYVFEIYFHEPDGNMTGSGMSHPNTAVANIGINPFDNHSLTISPVGKGTDSVQITMIDPEGTATQQLNVRVFNGPDPKDTIPDVSLDVGGSSADVDVSAYFDASDMGDLSYTAVSSDTAKVTVSFSDTVLTLTPVAAGTTTITARAVDSAGKHASQKFTATAVQPNQSPVTVGTIPDQTIKLGGSITIDAAPYFSDADGDALTYTVSDSDLANQKVSISLTSDGTVTIGTTFQTGTVTVRVYASDSQAFATQTFTVTVNPANRAPVANGTIPDSTKKIGHSDYEVDLSGYFTDADSDTLTYHAVSSDTSKATVSLSDATLSVTPVAVGTSTITTTATDPDGELATQTFTMTVNPANRAPVSTSQIPDQSMVAGINLSLDLSGYFSDADGDTLTYAVTIPAVHHISTTFPIASHIVTFSTPPQSLVAPVTVTVTDPDGASVSQTFNLTVSRQPTVVSPIPDQTVPADEEGMLDVQSYFNDPDGDTLTYTASSSNTGAVTVSVSGSTLNFTPTGQGSSTITATVSDPVGGTVSDTFTVYVGNPPTTVGTIPNQTVGSGWLNVTQNLNIGAYFSDPNGGTLTYSVSSSNSTVTLASMGTGAVVNFTPKATGTATVTVTATNTISLSVSSTFTVTVLPVTGSPPTVVSSIDAQFLEPLKNTTFSIRNKFSDPDGDALTYTVTSADTSIVTVRISNLSLLWVTISSQMSGSATTSITVTATDTSGLSVSQPVSVTVAKKVAPQTVGTIPAQSLALGATQSIDVSSYFRDPYGLSLTYTASSSQTSVIEVTSVSGSNVSIKAAPIFVFGLSATITVTATNTDNLSASQSFSASQKLSQADAVPGLSSGEQSLLGRLLTYDTIIFNELHNGSDDANDWLELRNVSNVEIPIDEWQLTIQTGRGSVVIPFPIGTVIPAGEVLLVTNTDNPVIKGEAVLPIVSEDFALPQTEFALILRSPTAFGDLAGNYFQDRKERAQTAPELTVDTVWYRSQTTVSGYRAEAWTENADGRGTPGYHPRSLVADLNSDGVVNILDLVLVASQFGTSGATPADLNSDGTVDMKDLEWVANALRDVAAAPAAEQSTAGVVNNWLRLARQNAAGVVETSLPEGFSYEGGILALEALARALTPESTALLANYPNPFNPETWIPYQLAKAADVAITIYAADGRVVRRLTLGHQDVGKYHTRSQAAYWDGRNDLGETVASGVYFYTLTAGDFAATRKMLILK